MASTIDVATTPPAEADDIPVVVDATLSPPSNPSQGFWIGRAADNDATRLAGWGQLAPRLVCRRGATIELTGIVARPEVLLFLPAASAIATRLASFNSLRSATVVGNGPLAALAGGWLRQQQVSIVPVGTAKGADVLIDTDGEPARWEQALSTVRDEGTVVLFVPPWASAADFDFYQVVHRRSLRLLAGRWHQPPQLSVATDLKALVPLTASAMADGRYVTGPTAGSSGATCDRWLLTVHP